MASEFVTLVNRTNDTLEGTYDGRPFLIKPGKSEQPRDRAIKFVEQNIIMGSEDPRTGQSIYKLGVEEMHMDCTPLTPEFIAQFDGSVEKWDRSKLTGSRPSQVVEGDNGLYSGSWKSSQSPNTHFTPAG